MVDQGRNSGNGNGNGNGGGTMVMLVASRMFTWKRVS